MIELLGRLTEIRIGDDRVSPVHALRLVTGDLHGYRPCDATALEIPDGGPTEVVRNAPGTPALTTAVSQRLRIPLRWVPARRPALCGKSHGTMRPSFFESRSTRSRSATISS
jgi:hypothetical protein